MPSICLSMPEFTVTRTWRSPHSRRSSRKTSGPIPKIRMVIAHGTFSFDISNGTCGILTGLQIVDGFLRSHTISCALITASDADPGRGMSEHFPFSPVGAALLCRWTDDDYGLGRVSWVNDPDDGEDFQATVGSDGTKCVAISGVAGAGRAAGRHRSASGTQLPA